jgi:hypothetical protein
MFPNYRRPPFSPPGQKPARGTKKLEHIDKTATAKTKEDKNKSKVRKRDGHCRWPHLTPEAKALCHREHAECAHLTAKGAGGDPLSIRSTPELMINVCAPVHQGVGSLHAGDRKVLFLTKDKAAGPLAFFERRGARGKWVEVARELWPGVLAPRTS